MNYSLEVCKAI